MNIVIFGLSITSSWSNGHATTYRGLVRELAARGHDVLFLERDVPWYRENRDLLAPPYGTTRLYASLLQLKRRYASPVAEADAVIVGSYVPQGTQVIAWVRRQTNGVVAFYDIDRPVTLAALERGRCRYVSRASIPRLDLYLSFTGGPTLQQLQRRYGARRARALYCAVDPKLYYPEDSSADTSHSVECDQVVLQPGLRINGVPSATSLMIVSLACIVIRSAPPRLKASAMACLGPLATTSTV